MAAASQAKLLPCFPQLFPQTRAPPSCLQLSSKKMHLEAETRLLALSLSPVKNSVRVPIVFSKQHTSSPNWNDLFPFKTEEPHKPTFSDVKKLIRPSLVLILSCFLFCCFRKPKIALALTDKANSIDSIRFLKTSASLRAVAFFFLYKTVAFSPPVIISIIAFSGPVQIVLHPLTSYFLNPQAPAADNFPRLLAIIRNTISLFSYIVPSCWIISVICLLYWQYTNQVITVEEAKRFYPLFGVCVNVSIIFLGHTAMDFPILKKYFGSDVHGCAIILWELIAVVIRVWPPTSSEKNKVVFCDHSSKMNDLMLAYIHQDGISI